MSAARKLILLTVFLLVAFALAGCGSELVEELPYSLAPDSSMPSFLHNADHRFREAYRFAAANMQHLENIPCYCGCNVMGHASNYACYVKNVDPNGTIIFDTHGAGCKICVDITQDVMRMLREGESMPDIRAYIDATYGRFGPSTDTALPT